MTELAVSRGILDQPGTVAFLVIFGMAVILFFVFRSMAKHLRKINMAARAEAEAAAKAQAAAKGEAAAEGQAAVHTEAATWAQRSVPSVSDPAGSRRASNNHSGASDGFTGG